MKKTGWDLRDEEFAPRLLDKRLEQNSVLRELWMPPSEICSVNVETLMTHRRVEVPQSVPHTFSTYFMGP
jgi:hypothetical protein